jgi:hypothetical protein
MNGSAERAGNTASPCEETARRHAGGGRYAVRGTRYAVRSGTRRRAGEKLFIDYSGKKPRIVDPQTGKVTEVEPFVVVLDQPPKSPTNERAPRMRSRALASAP